MRQIAGLLFLLLSYSVFAGGDSKEVQLRALEAIGNGHYVLRYTELDTGNRIEIQLAFGTVEYLLTDSITREKFEDSIALLENQLRNDSPVRFGSIAGGPCIVDESKNIFRSDALMVLDEDIGNRSKKVVYALCEYK